MTLFEQIIEDVVTVLEKPLAIWFGIWHSLKRYILVTSVAAGFALLICLAFTAMLLGDEARHWITDNIYKLIFGSIAVGLVYAHTLYQSWPTLFFVLLTAALIFGLVRPGNAGELTEAIAATELKITPRGTGEDLQQALGRAREKLPEGALAVGVECVPESDGLINCSYLYRIPKGAEAAPVNCQDFSPYRLCMHNNTCYGEGAIVSQDQTKRICRREGTSYSSDRDEYRRLVWVPLFEK